MSHFMTEDQAAFRAAAENFTRREIEPLANEIDQTEQVPAGLTQRFAEQGFFGLFIPEAYGGLGSDLVSTCLVIEEVARASPAFAGLVSVQMILCPEAIKVAGSEEQKQRLLPTSASGEQLMAYSQTEPAGTANRSAHLTKLTQDGNTYRLNGAKLFCTQGEGTVYLVQCRTEREGEQGYGCVIVEKNAIGFHIAPYEQKLGWRGTNTGSISFDNVSIRPEDIVGDMLTANASFFPTANQASFLGHCASSLGCVIGMFDKTLAYVKDRQLYGAPMASLSPISDRLASVHGKIEAMRATLYTGARLYDEGRRDLIFGSIAKAWLCETAFDCCNTLLQMWGGSGIMDSTGINRYFRDARTNMIAEGSTEIHHARVAALLGLL